MSNVTLDVFWLEFMPIYHHVIGASTFLLSALVIYLMVTKTPWHGRPLARYLILMQLAILIVDFCWGFLFCPVLLFPLSAAICTGFICGSELGMHIGVVLLFQCMIQVALSVTFTLHHKYSTIVRMTNHRIVTNVEKVGIRLFYWAVLELPVAGMVISGASQQDLREFVNSERQFALAELLDRDSSIHGAAYSIQRFLWIPITLAALVVSTMILTVAGCAFFVGQTLLMLSKKTSSMSERTRKLQKGLTMTLIMQLTIPLVIQIVPLFIYVISMAMFWWGPGFINSVLCLQLFHASFHTIFLIMTTPSYRATMRGRSNQGRETVVSSMPSFVNR